MTISIVVGNYRGVHQARFDIDKIALIAGCNGQGKTSLAQAVASVMTNTPLPPSIGMKKSEAVMLVNRSANEGFVEASRGADKSRMKWPSCEKHDEGNGLKSSSVAVGNIKLADCDQKQFTQFMIEHCKSLPTKEDVSFELDVYGLGKYVDHVWVEIEGKGWDAALKFFKERGAKAKGAWETFSGENYGDKKAENWSPAGYDIDQLSTSREIMAAEKIMLEEKYKKAITAQAVENSKDEGDEALARQIPDIEDEVAKLEKESDAADKKHTKHSMSVRPVIPTESEQCPHCGEGLSIERGKIVAAKEKKMTDVERSEIEKSQKIYDTGKAILDADFKEKYAKVIDARARLVTAKQAVARLKKGKEAAKAQDAPSYDAEKIKSEIDALDKLMDAVFKYDGAKKNASIVKNTAIVIDIIAPEGLRKQKLSKSLVAFNERLSVVCEAAQWSAVEVRENMTIVYGGFPFALISESEKYRVNAILQMAVASTDGSDLMVFDGADILDGKGRNGLLNAITIMNIPSVIAMTYQKTSLVPDLAGHGIGNSYWIDGGVLSPINQKKEAP